MAYPLVVAREELGGARFDHRHLEVIARKGADVVDRPEARQGHEGDLAAVHAPEHVGREETRDPPHGWEQPVEQEPLVVVRVFCARPAAPHASDHLPSLGNVFVRAGTGTAIVIWNVGWSAGSGSARSTLPTVGMPPNRSAY